ncbi:MAG: Ig-like domain-containing protein [Chitinophagia bacterium]|jgi:hypothetical protein
MNKSALIKILMVGCYAFVTSMQITGCANIVPPLGGPRDSLPPYLVVAKPHDSSVNIQPKEILIAFNEFINSTSVQENLIVSPTLKNVPLVDAKLNMLKVRIIDSLQPNTTYSLAFGNAIKDVNEGNIAANFTYVFSTGDHLDTGTFKGTVTLAETGKIDTTLIVVLQSAEKDSAIFKEKPLYYTKINGKGKFIFHFLPPKKYNLFVLPNDFNKKYDDSTKFFAFANEPIAIQSQPDSMHLYVFQGAKKAEKKRVSNNKVANKVSAGLKYSKNLDGSEQDLLKPLHLIFETPVHLNDSFPILLCDTLNHKIAGYQLFIDSAHPETIVIDYPWTAQTKFRVILPKASIKDSLNNTLSKTDTLKFVTKSDAFYGSCIIRINGFDEKLNQILQLTQDDKIKYSYPITKNTIQIEKLPPGDYTLRLLNDTNKNGIWDTGSYYGKQKKQPEIVQLLATPLNIKANWENELILTINK